MQACVAVLLALMTSLAGAVKDELAWMARWQGILAALEASGVGGRAVF